MDLRKAAIKDTEEKYIYTSSMFAFFVSSLLTAFLLLVFLKEKWPVYLLLPVFMFFYSCFLMVLLSLPKSIIKSRKAMVESDILYSARYFLLKLESGSPLVNALSDVAMLETKSSKAFEEVVSDIMLGTPIEQAVDNAIKYGVSPAMTKILEEIQNSLKTGSDIDKTLKVTLEDITKNHVIQIQAYGKTLSPISMFYMIIGTIIPSIGVAMLVIASAFLPGFISQIDAKILGLLMFVVAVVQGFFILLFKSIKPGVMT